jgi:hypothetical protein
MNRLPVPEGGGDGPPRAHGRRERGTTWASVPGQGPPSGHVRPIGRGN